jgi:hypothetical protein
VREVPRLWMSPSWGPWRPSGPRHQGGREEQVLPVGDTDPRASENTRGKPRRDASRGVAVHARDGPGPQCVETVARSLRPASQVHPQTRVKDTLGDAILVEVTDPGVRLETGRPHRHQLVPGLIAAREPVRERRVGFETQHPQSVLDSPRPAGKSSLSPCMAAAQASPDFPHARFGHARICRIGRGPGQAGSSQWRPGRSRLQHRRAPRPTATSRPVRPAESAVGIGRRR